MASLGFTESGPQLLRDECKYHRCAVDAWQRTPASRFKIRGGFGEDRELRHELHPTDTRGDPGPGMPRSSGVDLDPCPRLLFPLPPLPVRGDRLRLRVGRSAGKGPPPNQCLCLLPAFIFTRRPQASKWLFQTPVYWRRLAAIPYVVIWLVGFACVLDTSLGWSFPESLYWSAQSGLSVGFGDLNVPSDPNTEVALK